MRIVITGAEGFIGKNLRVRLHELGYDEISAIGRATPAAAMGAALASADFVFHLAGVNRPKDEIDFMPGNAGIMETLCAALEATGRRTPILYASSTQAVLDNPYGRSKRAAEEVLLRYGRSTRSPVYVCRLTNVFGKWSRPDYNSAVATFCHRITRKLPITINDPTAPLRLVYVDDVVQAFVRVLESAQPDCVYFEVEPIYETTVGDLARTLQEYDQIRESLLVPRVGTGFLRALYATYISYLPPDAFMYQVPSYVDARGEFVEMLKTPDCGQFSYFTAHPGVTRGEHYHHTKTEKFAVICGTARFGFRHIITNEQHEVLVRGGEGRIVETVPGWAHNITNVGDDELIVMLWANEIFDKARPDTLASRVAS